MYDYFLYRLRYIDRDVLSQVQVTGTKMVADEAEPRSAYVPVFTYGPRNQAAGGAGSFTPSRCFSGSRDLIGRDTYCGYLHNLWRNKASGRKASPWHGWSAGWRSINATSPKSTAEQSGRSKEGKATLVRRPTRRNGREKVRKEEEEQSSSVTTSERRISQVEHFSNFYTSHKFNMYACYAN